jgi:hypothetical protein
MTPDRGASGLLRNRSEIRYPVHPSSGGDETHPDLGIRGVKKYRTMARTLKPGLDDLGRGWDVGGDVLPDPDEGVGEGTRAFLSTYPVDGPGSVPADVGACYPRLQVPGVSLGGPEELKVHRQRSHPMLSPEIVHLQEEQMGWIGLTVGGGYVVETARRQQGQGDENGGGPPP